MSKQTLAVLPESFSIHSFPQNAELPAVVLAQPLYFIGRTRDELSIVVPDTLALTSESCDAGWRILEVLGPLQLSMVGIMASIGSVLAKARVSIFVVSTFETDYFLVKQPDLERAIRALQQDGYKVD